MGRTPLHIACIRSNAEVVTILLQNGSNINKQDKEKCTPLHYAVINSAFSVIELVVAGAKQNKWKIEWELKNYQNKTCVACSVEDKICKLFESIGVGSKSDDYSNPIKYGDVYLNHNRSTFVERMLFMQKQQNLDKKKPVPKQVQEQLNTSKPAIIEIFDYQENEEKQEEKKKQQLPEKIAVSPASFNYLTRLGKGAFGEVYLVEKICDKRLYAMKVLQKSQICQQNLLRYAKTERNVLTLMRHPFIVQLKFAFQNSTQLFMVMDYCPGGDLGKLLSKKKKFSEETARLYLNEIILAIESLHKNCIIFRDLKPENVVLDEDGHAMLTDFGLSKEGINKNIQSRSFCGSVAYLAPEMLAKTGHGQTVDYYLLGVLLYELLVGIPPYFSNNRNHLFQNIIKGPLLLPKWLSEDCKHLMKRLLCRNPNARLGAKNGVEEIKQHPWFKEVDWAKVMVREQNMPKPKVPQNLRNMICSVQFGSFQYPNLQLQNKIPSPKQQEQINIPEDLQHIPGFSFVGNF